MSPQLVLYGGILLLALHFLLAATSNILDLISVGRWSLVIVLEIVSKFIGFIGAALLALNVEKFNFFGTLLCMTTSGISLFWIWDVESTIGLTNFTVTHFFGAIVFFTGMCVLFAYRSTLCHFAVQRWVTLLVLVASALFLLSDISLIKRYNSDAQLIVRTIADLLLSACALVWFMAMVDENQLTGEEREPLVRERAKSEESDKGAAGEGRFFRWTSAPKPAHPPTPVSPGDDSVRKPVLLGASPAYYEASQSHPPSTYYAHPTSGSSSSSYHTTNSQRVPSTYASTASPHNSNQYHSYQSGGGGGASDLVET